jgi:DNA mismatch repair ATPase MutS
MQNISTQINSKKLSFCKFSQKYTKIKKLFHPNILDADAVKNDATLNKNIIITGPNAAGKTTILKSIIINLLLSQQFGIGFYGSKTIIKPYDFIHCYINIPDTSQRDSLFQAEARRCKNILDIITKNPDKTHFCIFDELFSGTNPYEAISCGTSYLHYLSKLKNVTFLLTTHFDKLCKLLNKNSNIVNKHMKSSIIHNNPVYHYKMVDGISSVRGAITVLRDLSFGESIISKAEKILTQL